MSGLLIVSFKSFFDPFDKSTLSEDQKKTNINYTFNIITKFKSLGVRIIILYDGDPQVVMNFFNESILANDKFIPRKDILQEGDTFEKKYQLTESCILDHNKTHSASVSSNREANSDNVIILDSNYNYIEYLKQRCPTHFHIQLIHASFGHAKVLEYKFKHAQLEMSCQILSTVCTELTRFTSEKNRDLKNSLRSSGLKSPSPNRSRPSSGNAVSLVQTHEKDSLPKAEEIVSRDSSVLSLEQIEQLKAALYTLRSSTISLNVIHLKKNRIAIREKWERVIKYYLVSVSSEEELQNELRFHEQKIDVEIQKYLSIIESSQIAPAELEKQFKLFYSQTKRSTQTIVDNERTRVTQSIGIENDELLPYLIELTLCYDKSVESRRMKARKQIAQVTQETQAHIKALENDQTLLAHTYEMHRVKLIIDIIASLKESLEADKKANIESFARTPNADDLIRRCREILQNNIEPDLLNNYINALKESPTSEYIAKESELLLINSALKKNEPAQSSNTSTPQHPVTEMYVKLSIVDNSSLRLTIELLIALLIEQEINSFLSQIIRFYFNGYEAYLSWLVKQEAQYCIKLNKLIEHNNELQQKITDKCTSIDQATKVTVREFQNANLQCSTIFVNLRTSSLSRAHSGSGSDIKNRPLRPSVSSVNTHEHPLFSACKQGLAQKFQEELAKIPSSELKNTINSMTNSSRKTLLDVVCQNGWGGLLSKLIFYGANVHLSLSGFPPLFYAVEAIDQDLDQNPSFCVVTQLLDAGAVINSTTVDEKFNTPLHKAAKISVGRAITHIIKHGTVSCPGSIDIHYKNNLEHTALYTVFIENTSTLNLTNVIEQFYAQGIGLRREEMHSLRKDYKKEMEEAIQSYQNQIQKRLQIFQAAKFQYGTTRPDSVRLSPADKNNSLQGRPRAGTGSGFFSSVFTSKTLPDKKYIFKSELLMNFYENKIKPIPDNKLPSLNQCDEIEGLAPIHVLCLSSEKNLGSLAYLLRLKVNVNLVSSVKESENNSSPVKGKGKEKEKVKLGLTALHYACESGREDLVIELLKVPGIQILPDENGMTPLHSAIIKGHGGIVRQLLKHLCPTQRPGQNKTSYDYLTLYQKYQAEGSTIENKPQTAFMKALILGHKDVLNAFAEYGFVIADDQIDMCLAVLEKMKPDQALPIIENICEHLKEASNTFRIATQSQEFSSSTLVHSPGRPSWNK